MKRQRRLAALAVAAVLAACGGVKENPILQLSAEEALARGQELIANEKYTQARDYLVHAFEVEPNSPSGRTALLLAADTHYLDGGQDNFVKAEAKYRDFQNRFPTSDRAAYVQMQIANSLASRMLKADRDQSSTRRALDAYQEVLQLFPTSEYAEEAERQIVVVRNRLAESEFLVGRYYLRSGRTEAAARRFEHLLENYPDYGEMDKALYFLGTAYQRSDELEKARETFDRLAAEYSDSPYREKIPSIEVAG